MSPTVFTESPEDTERLGERLGASLESPLCIELRGELGAGKTCWVRGLARGLGVDDPVRSPTFTICHVHRGRLPLFHLDASRLGDPEELLEQGWDEMCARGVVAVEWGDRIAPIIPEDRLCLELEHDPGGRRIELRARGPGAARVLATLDLSDFLADSGGKDG